MTPDRALSARGVTFGYDVPLLHGIDFDVEQGECVALLGANGAGKTTLLRLLGGLLSPEAGTVRWGGEDAAGLAPSRRARGIGYLPQRTPRSTGFRVHEIVLMGLYPLLPARGWEGPSEWLAVGRALQRVGARHLLRRPFDELSGGEQRRVLLARALVARPAMLLLDEPLAALDPGFVLEFTANLERLRDQGVGLVVSTHRLSFVRAIADRVLVLKQGEVIETGPPDAVLRAEILNSAYDTERFGSEVSP